MRMALGAAWLDILRLVVMRGLVVSAIGVAVGLVGVLGGARLLRGFLFSVTPTDPIAIGGAALLMLTIAAIACYIPARRAAGEDPVQALARGLRNRYRPGGLVSFSVVDTEKLRKSLYRATASIVSTVVL